MKIYCYRQLLFLMSFMLFFSFSSMGEENVFKAGVARASITPLEIGLPTQLGGYGARAGKPAEGIHDTLYAKTLMLEWKGNKAAIVTLDVCSVPACVVEESVTKAAIQGLTPTTVIFSASHSHAGIEGFSLDRRNIANNPHIGVFDEQVLNFVTDRIAQALRDAEAALQPVNVAYGSVRLPGMTRNRRGDGKVDPDLTIMRLDNVHGKPYVVLVNFTAHGTIMTENEMLLGGCWPGYMQRTVEDLMPGVTCLYTNGAEGDISPVQPEGGSQWEKAEKYGRRVGIVAAKLATTLISEPVVVFKLEGRPINLPSKKVPPNFAQITGDEYKVDENQLQLLLDKMFPAAAPILGIRVNQFMMITFPGEPICEIGMTLKDRMRRFGITTPCVASLCNDHIGYILTSEEYEQGGYESTTSFYGPTLGPLLLDLATVLAQDLSSNQN